MKNSIHSTRQEFDVDSLTLGFAEHLRMTLGDDQHSATMHDKYMALAYTIRDKIINQWVETQQTHYESDAKRIYYLSLEFLMGRAMGNNIINMKMEENVKTMLESLGYSLEELREEEVDAGLGNGGLGRLAACFLDSLATLDIPAFGYGIRYNYGIFNQKIENGWQIEFPDDWLRNGNPWEFERPNYEVVVNFGGEVKELVQNGKTTFHWINTDKIVGVPYDTPIVGYGGKTVNTLRLWSSKAANEFIFGEFDRGDYFQSVKEKVIAENITQVLYPNDKLYLGKELRLKQQYFFVACSLKDILRRYKKVHSDWSRFPDFCAIQLNDTHPAIAVAELMRLFIDEEELEWNDAWEICTQTFAYTNHTLMPEALEKWPVKMFEQLLPRHLQIIYQINYYFLQKVNIHFPNDNEKLARMSLIEEGPEKQIRMAYLSIVASHSVNGVAALHTELLKSRLVPDFSEFYPNKFNNKTNGITQRRWLLKANPNLSELITKKIGDGWITDLAQLKKLEAFAKDSSFLNAFAETKKAAKHSFAEYLYKNLGWQINENSIFDFQVKRIHEYKRQLLNALHVIMLYNRIKKGNDGDLLPRTVFIGGKAAPGYRMAKYIIKLINNLSAVINSDPDVNRKLNIYFLPNYRVSLAERIFPAAEISEQISTAGTEASGTSNMKFMCNGALTIGTMDGANIEIAEEVGQENIFIFGLTAEEAAAEQKQYNPQAYLEKDPEIKEAVELLKSGHFNFGEPGIFNDLIASILSPNDPYLHLADLRSYADTQQKLNDLYKNQKEWNKIALLNVARSGKFSSDRTIREYAEEIWNIQPCPVAVKSGSGDLIEDAANNAADREY